MVASGSNKLLAEFSIDSRLPPDLYRSVAELDLASPLVTQLHAMRNAWRDLELSAILCVNYKPTVYFKEVARFDPEEMRRLHRRFWNHGVAPILVVASKTEVQVFSGLATPPGDTDDVGANGRLVQTLSRTAQVLEMQSLIRSIEMGSIYYQKPGSFNAELGVDRYLLRNLRAVRKLLQENGARLTLPEVHALLGRTIFTCYLLRREIIDSDYLARVGVKGAKDVVDILTAGTPALAKTRLYELFRKLQRDFRGDMFGDDLEKESRRVTVNHIRTLADFLLGHDLGDQQLTLGFWAYDFGVIPIETISAIYQDFMEAEGGEAQRQSGAYYTPQKLTDLVIDTAVDGWTSLLDKRVLDPACGSGIFLVSVFNRMAEEWRSQHPRSQNRTRVKALIEILKHNVCGVDVNETACRIACFSLYLALLDHLDPRDIEDLRKNGQVLPDLLLQQDAQPNDDQPRTILCRNFFRDDVPFGSRTFDLIVGNPPWVGRGNTTDDHFDRWCAAHPEYPVPQKQVANAFMWKAPFHLADAGRACFLLPANVLLNQTDDFQRRWFSRYAVDCIVQLSDMSFFLFPNAERPALIMRYRGEAPGGVGTVIEYLAPKTDHSDLRAGMISISADDFKEIDLHNVIGYAEEGEAPLLWKQHFWGTPRDVRLLDRLLSLPRLESLVGTPLKPKRWICGQGFQPLGKNDPAKVLKKAWWPKDHLLLDARSENIDLVMTEEACRPVGDDFQELRRSPDRIVFQPPMVLCNQGFSKMAYCDFPLLFRHSLQSIGGPERDADLLMFLTATLQSPLAKYVLFHTSANWGTERDKVLLSELLRMPFPLPIEVREGAGGAAKEVAAVLKMLRSQLRRTALGRDEVVAEAKAKIYPLIYQHYDIDNDERILVEDTAEVIEPSSTPTRNTIDIPTLRRTTEDDRKEYVALLSRTLNGWAKRSGINVAGSTTVSAEAGIGVVTLVKKGGDRRYVERKASDDMVAALARIQNVLPERRGSVAFLKGLKIFEQDRLHLVKPLTLRHWLKSTALNDADEVAAAILTSDNS